MSVNEEGERGARGSLSGTVFLWRRPKVGSKPRTGPASHVGFRLPDRLFDQLRERAERDGKSPGEYARRLVASVLEDEERKQTAVQLQAVQQELASLRADVATTLEMVLLNTVKVSPESVKKWVTEKLRR